MTRLRLEADDPAVREYTAKAFQKSSNSRPLLKFRCAACHKPLAKIVVVRNYGPLFVSTWDADTHRISVNGREVKGREKRRRHNEMWDTVSGRPAASHGVTALLRLPAGMTQEFPDLLMRCETHGDYRADRNALREQLRATEKPTDVPIQPSGVQFDYRQPPKERVVRRLKFSEARPVPTTVAELDELKGKQGAHIRRRRHERDTR